MFSLLSPSTNEEHSPPSTSHQLPAGNENATSSSRLSQEPNPSGHPTPHVAPAQNTPKDAKPENKSWNEMVFEALADLSLTYGGERKIFTAEEICERLEQVHGKDAPGINREARHSLVVLVLSMQKALWRKEGGYPPIQQPYLSLGAYEERIKQQQQRTPSPLPRAPQVPINTHISPAFHNHHFHSMPSPPSSPIKWSPYHTPNHTNGYHHRNTSRSGTIADVVAAAAVVEAEAASKIGRRLLFKHEDDNVDSTPNVCFSRYDRHQRQKSCGSPLLYQQPSPFRPSNYSPKSGKKKTKWRDLVNMTLRKLYRENPNRQAFRLKDIADLTEGLWDRLTPGKIKPGNFRASVAAVLSAYPEFTTGIGAGHQGWWSLVEMKDKGSDYVPAPATSNTPTPLRKLPTSRLVPMMDVGGVFYEDEVMAENISEEEDFDDDFFMRQGAIPQTQSSYGIPEPMLDDEVAEDGIDGIVKKRKKRKSQRMTWKSLLVWIMRDLADRGPSMNGTDQNVELQSQKDTRADVKGIWISMSAIVAEAEKRWAEYGPRASMSKYWKPTLRRTLVENPEFKCGSSGYGMNGMWTLAEFLQDSGCAMHAFDDFMLITPDEEYGAENFLMRSSSEESDAGFEFDTHGESNNFAQRKQRRNIPVYPCTPTQQNNMSMECKENEAILGLTSLFQHHTPDLHQYQTAADTDSESEDSTDFFSDDNSSSSECSSDDYSDNERPETPSPMEVEYKTKPSRDAPISGIVDEPSSPSPRGRKRKSGMMTRSVGDEKDGNMEVKRTELVGSTLSTRSPLKRTISDEKSAVSISSKAKQSAPVGAKRKNTTWTNALLLTFEELHQLNPGRTCFHFTEIYSLVDQRWHELFPDRIKNETWQRTISGRLSDIPNFVRTASAHPGWWKLRGKPDHFGNISDYSAPFPVYSGNKPRSRGNSSDSSVTPAESTA